MKYSFETKLEVVKAVLAQQHSCYSIANELGIAHTSVKYWLRQYEQHGEVGLMHVGKSYSGEFKLSVIKYMHEHELSYTETAIRFGIGNRNHIANWEHIYYEEGVDGLMKSRRGKSPREINKTIPDDLDKKTEKELIEEVQQLRMENAYLKKVNALVQEKERSAKKKK